MILLSVRMIQLPYLRIAKLPFITLCFGMRYNVVSVETEKGKFGAQI